MPAREDELAVLAALLDPLTESEGSRQEIMAAIPGPSLFTFQDIAAAYESILDSDSEIEAATKIPQPIIEDCYRLFVGGWASLATTKKLVCEWKTRAEQDEWSKASDRLGAGEDKTVVAVELAERLSALRMANGNGDSLSSACLSYERLADETLPPPNPILGERLFEHGGLMVLYGEPGKGKSWLPLQMVHACNTGQEWMGLATHPVNALLVSMELGLYDLQERLRSVSANTQFPGLRVLAPPRLAKPIDLLDPSSLAELEAAVKLHRITLLILDPLSSCHSGSEIEDMGKVLEAERKIRLRTGCATQLIHHERKLSGGERSDEVGLSGMRGHSLLRDRPDSIARLAEYHGSLTLEWQKVRHGKTPEITYLRKSASGCLIPTPKPKDATQKAHEGREQIAAFLATTDFRGASVQEIRAAVRLVTPSGDTISERTYQAHLDTLRSENRAVKIGGGRGSRWTMNPQSAEQKIGPADSDASRCDE